MPLTLDDLRRFAVTRSLFQPTTLERALDTLGFVQADPIRAPARAQDLTLRHRVRGYRAGDLERRYEALGIEEDFFVNYGFVTRAVYELMHPRARSGLEIRHPAQARRSAPELRARREARLTRARLTIISIMGRSRTTGAVRRTRRRICSTDMHYRGLLRVVRRDVGIRVYGVREAMQPAADKAGRARAARRAGRRRRAQVRAAAGRELVEPGATAPLRGAAVASAGSKPALKRAKQRLPHAHVDGIEWYWPAGETIEAGAAPEIVRLLAPFDPVVWDRRRFEMLWGWAYRFEAYTPVKKRERGYYALPLLWRDRVVGWGNVAVKDGALTSDFGYVSGRRPRDREFRHALDAEMERLRAFLDFGSPSS